MQNKKIQAFTFIELMIVMAIIAIMTGVGLSVLPKSLSGSGLQSSSRQVMGKINDGRSKAMLEQRSWEISFDLAKQNYMLMPLGTIKKQTSLKDSLALQANPFTFFAASSIKGDFGLKSIDEEKPKFTHEEDLKKVQEVQLPQHIKIRKVTLANQEYYDKTVSLTFNYRGMNKPCIVWLEDTMTNEKSTVYLPSLQAPILYSGHLDFNQINQINPSNQINQVRQAG